ncbi:Fe-S cluster assembly sulfur transfer protein SufU [Gimesia panareensis]|uniref:Fe-S cluster assembly sulfur transfer protein SufU n=1 Tax=Gimesia panareensis TaxID=2527978 RepID=UPI001189A086|nr:SUF system NifU family Fe-S cluster assembly protein [Gimesia panareensis]QDU52332.1 NifU-like protein [Gimesia panareensis]
MLDDELRELYQEVILDHQQDPRNFGPMQHPTHHAEGFNPLCGDRIRLELDMDGDRIRQMSFTGAGCAISTASASLMTEALTGKTRAEAEAVSQEFRDLVTGKLRDTEGSEAIDISRLGELSVLASVQQFPVRVKCVTLAWHTLEAALTAKKQVPISTE